MCAALAVDAAAEEPLAWHERAASWRTSVSFANGTERDPQWSVTVARLSVPARPLAGDVAPAMLGARAREASKAPHEGVASYYWQDQMTASGERFDRRAYTAAHKTLPIGTKVRVTHLKTGRTVVVRINDRGPFVAGRVIDLSEAAAEAIGMRSAGLAPVRLDVVHN